MHTHARAYVLPCCWCLPDAATPCTILDAGPIKALVQERQQDWHARFGGVLGLKVVQLSGDAYADELDTELQDADLICATPEKFGAREREHREGGSRAAGLHGHTCTSMLL